ncbi:MAG: hypothetical protein GFGODING_02501 [Flavobacteriales bacterium]|nr:hypothetical protein [Flavobacteriales bacterium]
MPGPLQLNCAPGVLLDPASCTSGPVRQVMVTSGPAFTVGTPVLPMFTCSTMLHWCASVMVTV